jgi:hypothetical protein
MAWTGEAYLPTNSTMNQARIATRTLPTNTIGTKRPQLNLDQGAIFEILAGEVMERV